MGHPSVFIKFMEQMPENLMVIPLEGIFEELYSIFHDDLEKALDPLLDIPSPLSNKVDSTWIKTANTVGVNLRTLGDFTKLIPYAFLLPKAQNAIHLLPFWEPGVVASLYGPSSWNINPEFYSHEFAKLFPRLNTPENQLHALVNVMHLMGKAIGMDVVPHTDRFSEMAVANPAIFEWLRRDGMHIADHHAQLHTAVEQALFSHLLAVGSATQEFPVPETVYDLFYMTDEIQRLLIMFGQPHNYSGRLARRKAMVHLLHELGYETVPATMGPPYRGIEVDPDPRAKVVDEDGLVWHDYRIVNPERFSRVFGPLARYRLYEAKNDNVRWELDFERPNKSAWQYVCDHYTSIQARYGFDFMRGDMSHVQMRPDGVPALRDDYYDLLGVVKTTVLLEKPYFGYFAESFLAPPGEMAFGDECDHLEASHADSTLGDLQSEPIHTDLFLRTFAQYRQWLDTRHFAPNFTVMTADKDDPRFDAFYLDGNEVRHFIALFLTDMPSYMALGFECRDPHPTPAPNEFYSKLYVFHERNGPKSTNGPYQWGQNTTLYNNLVRQRLFSDEIQDQLYGRKVGWIIPPDATGNNKLLAWTQDENPEWVFLVNLNTKQGLETQLAFPEGHWRLVFSTSSDRLNAEEDRTAASTIFIGPGEGFVFNRLPA